MKNNYKEFALKLAQKEAFLDCLAILVTAELCLGISTEPVILDLREGKNFDGIRVALIVCSMALFNYLATDKNHFELFLRTFPFAKEELKKRWEAVA